MKKKIFLNDYDVSAERGFLPERDPTPQMEHVVWARYARNLPKYLMTGQVREILDGMQLIDGCSITDERLEEAMMYLSFLGHAYVWGEPNPIEAIPANIAVPWCEIARRLGRPPILSYASYALNNWTRVNESEPIELGNIYLNQNFLGGADEEWFIMIHIDIEAKAGPAIAKLVRAHNFLNMEKVVDEKTITQYLNDAAIHMQAIHDTLKRTTEWCDPYIYYNRVRPYIHGWKNNPVYPDGIAYDGMNMFAGQKFQFRGETGAQSSVIPTLDALLSVTHKDDPLKEYLVEMRHYMPPKHRELMEEIEKYPAIKDFVEKRPGIREPNKNLETAYNKCVQIMNDFRTTHLEFAATYIHKQSSTGDANSTAVGTGGTPFMKYLKKHRDETVGTKKKK